MQPERQAVSPLREHMMQADKHALVTQTKLACKPVGPMLQLA